MRTRDMSTQLDARHLTASVVDGSTECEECFIKRKYSEIAPQITEDGITEVKNQRAQFVKNYFTEKKHQFGLK